MSNHKNNRQIEGISEGALQVMLSYSWPGNVRELRNVVERLVVLIGSGKISANDLPNIKQEKFQRIDINALSLLHRAVIQPNISCWQPLLQGQ